MKVYFENVGRDNSCWVAECKEEDFGYDWLYRQVKGKLLSREIDFYLSKEDMNKGTIIVGDVRPVGNFRIEK